MPKRLIYFYNDDCQYCLDLDDEIAQFAQHHQYKLIKVESGIIGENGEAEVPALMLPEHDTLGNHMFLGRNCLNALRYMLENG